MVLVSNFYFFYFLRLTWEFLDLKNERGDSIYWPNNKIKLHPEEKKFDLNENDDCDHCNLMIWYCLGVHQEAQRTMDQSDKAFTERIKLFRSTKHIV